MSKVYFSNNEELDPISITTFGINAKNNDSAIGYFGTGLKYAIAIILREGCGITIKSGSNTYKFSLDEQSIRGKSFSVVCMNGNPLGFTTELGKNWDLWMAYRELHCNTTDERGTISDAKKGKAVTTITVTGINFLSCYHDRANVILEGSPISTSNVCNIHQGESGYIFYKGVRIYEGKKPNKYTYNILRDLDISEDRSAKYSFQIAARLAKAITHSKDKNLIESCILAKGSYYESDLDYTDGQPYTSEFLDVASKLRLNIDANQSIHAVLRSEGKGLPIKKMELDQLQEKTLGVAVKFCTAIGYTVEAYPIVVSADLKGGLHGLAENDTIYISPDCFSRGARYIASALIEEYMHLLTGYHDETRELQTHLFNEIVTMGEKFLDEPI